MKERIEVRSKLVDYFDDLKFKGNMEDELSCLLSENYGVDERKKFMELVRKKC